MPAVRRTAPVEVPRYSLGPWVVDWCHEHLVFPDGEDAGEPWEFSAEQRDILGRFYAVDERGRFLSDYGVIQRMKGWGKDPFGCAVGLAELMGPVRFAGFESGYALAVPHPAPLVQLAATVKEQTRTMTPLFRSMIPERTIRKYRLSILDTVIHKRSWPSGEFRAIATNPGAQQGFRPSFALLNETHEWVTSASVDLANTIQLNLGKARDASARALALTNAYSPGGGSVAEADRAAWQAQVEAGTVTTYYDSLEPAEDVDLRDPEALAEMIEAIRGDSWWVDPERKIRDIHSGRMTEARGRRFYLNEIVPGEGAYIGSSLWDSAWRSGVRGHLRPEDGAEIALGFDGAINRDASALVGTDLASGYQWLIEVWERDWSDANWTAPIEEVDEVVADTMKRWRVARGYFNPYHWQESVARWGGEYGDAAVGFYTNTNTPRMWRALQAYRRALLDGRATHSAGRHSPMTRHVLAAMKEEVAGQGSDGEPMYVLRKKSRNSRECIDIAMASVLSYQARLDAIEKGALHPEVEVPFRVLVPRAERRGR